MRSLYVILCVALFLFPTFVASQQRAPEEKPSEVALPPIRQGSPEARPPEAPSGVVRQPGQRAPEAKPPEVPRKPTAIQVSGEVVKVDRVAKTLTLKQSKGTQSFDIATAQTTGYKSGDQIKVGDKVRITYRKEGGKEVVTAIAKAKPSKKK